MATITAGNIITKAQIILQDSGGVRWTTDELLGWLNDGQREIATYKPDASVGNVSFTPEAGTKQTLPADGLTLIGVTRTMGNGSTPGSAIRLVDKRILDDQITNWHALAPVDAPTHYCFDPRDQKVFYVYPPSTGGASAQFEIIYAKAPDDVADISSAISVDDIYSNALMDYILFRAYSKDVDYAADDGRARSHYEKFVQSMVGKEQGERSSEATAVLHRANSSSAQVASGQASPQSTVERG